MSLLSVCEILELIIMSIVLAVNHKYKRHQKKGAKKSNEIENIV